MKTSPPRMPKTFSDAMWEDMLRRWRQGAWRAAFFRDLVLADARTFGPRPVLLDIGCGRGFDGEPALQASLAEAAGQYLGIEPDRSLRLGDCFTAVHRCRLEDAPLKPESIDLAFAVFVIEHLPHPRAFFDAVLRILAPRGVFWGFTIDRRHPFAMVSLASDCLGIKAAMLSGRGNAESGTRPRHCRAYYRANTPAAIRRWTTRFRSIRTANLHQVGQFDAYLPAWIQPISRALDSIFAKLLLPGPMLVVRLEK